MARSVLLLLLLIFASDNFAGSNIAASSNASASSDMPLWLQQYPHAQVVQQQVQQSDDYVLPVGWLLPAMRVIAAAATNGLTVCSLCASCTGQIAIRLTALT